MVIVSITPELAIEGGKTYAGGLGILEGDKLLGAGDMGLDYVALTLFYRQGYVSVNFQGTIPLLNSERQPKDFLSKLRPDEEFTITLKGSEIIIRPWIYTYKTAKAVFFEAVCPMWARKLTDRVYMEDSIEETFYKYALLAKASAYYLKHRIGLENVSVIDLEESYTSLILNLLDIGEFSRIVIHTPGPWGHPGFPGELIAREFGVFLGDYVNLTEFALSRLKKAIVVSQKQVSIIPKIFPKYSDKIEGITNGVHLERWMHPRLYEGWKKGSLSKELLVNTRAEARRELESLVRQYKPEAEFGNRPVLTWARRLARYKRPYFITRFILEHPDVNAVFIIAGKPHPRDNDGYEYLKQIRDLSLKLSNVIYIPDYGIETAKKLVQGSDLWLFTPFSGWEACGTSYMKALANGVPVLSSRDGGVVEVVEDGFNGWLFGEDLREFINIYTDPRARDIDEKEYREFEKKLLEIIDMYNKDRDKYYDVAFNALVSTPSKIDITVMLKKYYLMEKR